MCIAPPHVQLSFMKFDLFLTSNGPVGTNLLKFRQSKGNNSCISETNVTKFDVHQHTIAKYSITIIYMKFHRLVSKLYVSE